MVYFFPVFILLLFSQNFSAKRKCKFEFPDYYSCGLIISKLLNQSVHAFFIRTVNIVNILEQSWLKHNQCGGAYLILGLKKGGGGLLERGA